MRRYLRFPVYLFGRQVELVVLHAEIAAATNKIEDGDQSLDGVARNVAEVLEILVGRVVPQTIRTVQDRALLLAEVHQILELAVGMGSRFEDQGVDEGGEKRQGQRVSAFPDRETLSDALGNEFVRGGLLDVSGTLPCCAGGPRGF